MACQSAGIWVLVMRIAGRAATRSLEIVHEFIDSARARGKNGLPQMHSHRAESVTDVFDLAVGQLGEHWQAENLIGEPVGRPTTGRPERHAPKIGGLTVNGLLIVDGGRYNERAQARVEVFFLLPAHDGLGEDVVLF